MSTFAAVERAQEGAVETDEETMEEADSGCEQKENRQQQRVSRELLEQCFKTCLIWEYWVN